MESIRQAFSDFKSKILCGNRRKPKYKKRQLIPVEVVRERSCTIPQNVRFVFVIIHFKLI